MVIKPYGDNFIPAVPVDHVEHTCDNPFCWNETCICHEDNEAITAINQAVQDGLITPEEATDFVLGRLL